MSSEHSHVVSQKPSLESKPLVIERLAPHRLERVGDGHWFLDFGRAAFGTVEITSATATTGAVLHLGEKPAGEHRIDREPGGSVRYRRIPLSLLPAGTPVRVPIPPDERNTGAMAVPMPAAIGAVMPFRYAELEGWPTTADPPTVRQLAVFAPFNDDAADFRCSDPVLNDVWDLCKYSIKATTFCGVYVDGDRERIPYESDAYINQLCHYGVDAEYSMARRTLEWLLAHPTWPTEWQFHVIMMAWAEYQYTGADDLLRARYDQLVTRLLLPLAREDGLLSTASVPSDLLQQLNLTQMRDIVDWPAAGFGGDGVPGERDGYDMRPVNTVVNAFHAHALNLMASVADVIGRPADAIRFRERRGRVLAAMERCLVSPDTGCYVDGEGSSHSALHANICPLAFGLVPTARHERVVAFIRSRGMACSVYGAQHLLDGLFTAGQDAYALELLTATHERSWAHMLYDVGSTITLEAWAPRFKPNLDWNHAWGAAPANLIPRWVLGVQPAAPGFASARIQPQLGALDWAEGKVPTPHGPIHVRAERRDGRLVVNHELPPMLQAHAIRMEKNAPPCPPLSAPISSSEA